MGVDARSYQYDFFADSPRFLYVFALIDLWAITEEPNRRNKGSRKYILNHAIMTNEEFNEKTKVWLGSKAKHPDISWNLKTIDAERSEVELTCCVKIEKNRYSITGACSCFNGEKSIEIAVKELYDNFPIHIQNLLKQYAKV